MTVFLNSVSMLGHPLGFLWMMSLVVVVWSIRLKNKKLIFFSSFYSLIFWLIGFIPFSNWLVMTEEQKWAERGGDKFIQTAENKDYVIVLGGGVIPSDAGIHGMDLNSASDRLFTGLKIMKLNVANQLIISSFDKKLFPNQQNYQEGVMELAKMYDIPKDSIQFIPPSQSTFDEAQKIKDLLDKSDGTTPRGYLVTSAFHMDRSLKLFRKAGYNIEPIACDFKILDTAPTDSKYPEFIPRKTALEQVDTIVHEWIGRLVYQLRGWI